MQTREHCECRSFHFACGWSCAGSGSETGIIAGPAPTAVALSGPNSPTLRQARECNPGYRWCTAHSPWSSFVPPILSRTCQHPLRFLCSRALLRHNAGQPRHGKPPLPRRRLLQEQCCWWACAMPARSHYWAGAATGSKRQERGFCSFPAALRAPLAASARCVLLTQGAWHVDVLKLLALYMSTCPWRTAQLPSRGASPAFMPHATTQRRCRVLLDLVPVSEGHQRLAQHLQAAQSRPER